jgi:hypothetical protein
VKTTQTPFLLSLGILHPVSVFALRADRVCLKRSGPRLRIQVNLIHGSLHLFPLIAEDL